MAGDGERESHGILDRVGCASDVAKGRRRGRRTAGLALAVGIGLLLAPEAQAGCDVIPSVTDESRAFLGSISPAALTPGLSAQVFARPAVCRNPERSAASDFAVPSGCTLAGGPCTRLDADDFAISLFYRPTDPSAARNVLVLRSSCTGFDEANACGPLPNGGQVRCIDPSSTEAARFTIQEVVLGQDVSERRMSFVVPDTTGLFAAGQLAGPVAVAVTRVSDPLPCGLAASSCRDFFGSSPLVTCADTLFLKDGTCTTDPGSIDPVGVAVTSLPSPNLFADLCPVAESPSCRFQGAGAPAVRAAQDVVGNLLVPVDFQGFTGDPNFAMLLQGGFQVGGVPVRIPNADFVETRSLRNFAEVVPVFEVSPLPESEGVVQGTLDARLIVYRVFARSCAEDPAIPCSVDAECTMGCGAPLATMAFAPVGTGPLSGSCADAAGSPVCRVLDSFMDVASVAQASEDNRLRAFAVNECAAQLTEPPLTMSRNDELAPDLLDQVLVLRDAAANLAVQKPAPGTFDAIALTRLVELPFEFGSQDVEGEVAAWLSPELGDCFAGPELCDRTGNGLVFDHLLRAFRLDDPSSETAIDLLVGATLQSGGVPTNGPGGSVPLRTDLAQVEGDRLVLGAEPGRNVGTAATQVSGERIFFRASPFAHLARTVELVNAGSEGVVSALPGREVRISPDGGFATFTSRDSDLVPGPSGTEQVFLKRLATGEVIRVSEPGCSQQELEELTPNGASGGGVPSRDGRWVAFWSFASNLVPGDDNGRPDVFARDTTSCQVVRVSVDSAGNEGNDTSLNPWISADGRKVVFESRATNLDPSVGDTNNAFDVFLHDRDPDGHGFDVEASTVMISVTPTGSAPSGSSSQAVVSEDGEGVAFVTTAPDLAAGEGSGQLDVVAGAPGTLSRASTDAEGVPGALSSLKPRISGDGRFVSFVSDAALVPEDQNDRRDAYVKDLETGQLYRAGDFRAAPECRESVAGLLEFVPDADGLIQDAAISADGALLVYATTSSNLAPNDVGATSDIVVEDLRTGHVALVSAAWDGSGPGDGSSGAPSIGNRTIGFQSSATNLGPLGLAPLNVFANQPAGGDGDLRPRLGILDARDGSVRILDLPAEHVKAAKGVALVVAAGESAKLVRETCGGIVGGADCDDGCAGCGLVVEDLLHPAVSAQEAISIDEQFACALVTDLVPGQAVASCHRIGDDPAASLDPIPLEGGGLVPAVSVEVRNGRAIFVSPEAGGRALYETDLATGDAARRVQETDKAVLGDEIGCFTTFRRDFDPGCVGAACDQKEMFITAPGEAIEPIACGSTVRDCDQRSCFPALPFSANPPGTCKFITPAEIDVDDCVAEGLDLNADGQCTLLVAHCTRVGAAVQVSFGAAVDAGASSNPVAPETQAAGGTLIGVTGGCFPLVDGVPDLTKPPSGPCPCSSFEACVEDGRTALTVLSPDSDGDGIPDHADSCPKTPNLGIDFDGDGIDDACDGFVCGDGIVQRAELCDDGALNGTSQSTCSDRCMPAVRINVLPPHDRSSPPFDKDSPKWIAVAILGSELLVPAEDLALESLVFAGSVAGEPCATDPAQGATPLDFEVPFDVDHDGFEDSIVFFRIRDAGFQSETVEACLTGAFLGEIGPFGSEAFEARDAIRVKPPGPGCGLGAELALVLAPLVWLRRRLVARAVSGAR